MDRRLARRCLSHAPLQHVAHDDFVDRAAFDAGAAHGFADHEGAEFGSAERRETPEVFADGGADGTDDYGGGGVVGHSSIKLSSFLSFSTNSATGITCCLFPAPRARTATLRASASRCPTTAM